MSGAQLALCASERHFSVALRTAAQTFLDRPEASGAGDMAARVQTLCARHGISASSIDEVRVDVGPGSYTGLRVAVTFARVLATFGQATIRTTTSLELMALAAWRAGAVDASAQVQPVLDARRRRFHHGAVRLRTGAQGEIVETVRAPAATELSALDAVVQSGDVLLADASLHETLAPILAAREAVRIDPHPFDAALMFDARVPVVATPPEDLEPLYLMGSYAET